VMNLPANFTFPNGMENDSVLSIPGGQTLTLNGAGLDNEGFLTLAGGNLLLSTSAVNLNHGNFSLYASAPFQLGAAPLLNAGVLNLNGSLLNGTGGVT